MKCKSCGVGEATYRCQIPNSYPPAHDKLCSTCSSLHYLCFGYAPVPMNEGLTSEAERARLEGEKVE